MFKPVDVDSKTPYRLFTYFKVRYVKQMKKVYLIKL